MRTICRRIGVGLVVVMLFALATRQGPQAADPPSEVKISSFAPADDLLRQTDFFIRRIGESLADKADFDLAKQSRTKKDANTLAVLALVLGLHDEDRPVKASAPALVKAAQDLAEASEDYDKAAAALERVMQARSGAAAGGGAPLKWEAVASLPLLMKQVPLVHAPLKRGVSDARRFKQQSADSAAQAATLAAIAQASMFDTSAVKNPADGDKWRQFCSEMRDAAGAVNSAVHAGSQDQSAAALIRLTKSCEACHEIFRKEK